MVLHFQPPARPAQPLNFFSEYVAMLVHYERVYLWLYFLVSEGLQILKGSSLAYPGSRFIGD
jgi:hypothetical protein